MGTDDEGFFQTRRFLQRAGVIRPEKSGLQGASPFSFMGLTRKQHIKPINFALAHVSFAEIRLEKGNVEKRKRENWISASCGGLRWRLRCLGLCASSLYHEDNGYSDYGDYAYDQC
jgi:hypothetical protein